MHKGREIQAIDKIKDSIMNDSLVVFVGAGISAESGLPKWSELIESMKDDLSVKENDYLKVAQFYFDTFGKQEYLKKINTIFNKNKAIKTNEIHERIKEIHPKHVITTNYDTLLEDSLNAGISKYNIIASDDDIPYSNSNHYIIKMHGDFKKNNMVFKEEDYLDYKDNFPMISTLIKSVIMNNTVLFLGYSLNDSTFNSIFRLIHNSFGENAKKAYFFTASTPADVVIEYYKKKGIYVLSDSENVPESEIGKRTLKFVSEISKSFNYKANDQNQLWRKVQYLDKLSFVESQDIVNASTLNGKAFLKYPNEYIWIYEDSNLKNIFELSKDSSIIRFINDKTLFSEFLKVKTNIDTKKVSVNSVLKPAFNLYKEQKYTEAKKEFRRIANEAYLRKDYTNFLIAEFNVSHIAPSFFEKQSEMETPIYGETDFFDVLKGIIENSDLNDRKIAMYLRDNIFNFKFIYRKMDKIINLLDVSKEEHDISKNGGVYNNNNLNTLRLEFYSFITFIDANCICVRQYREFKEIIDKYFEALLLALDNSKNSGNTFITSLFGKTSSTLKLIEKDDIDKIVPYVNFKALKVFINDYSLDKITISDDAYSYLIDEIKRLSGICRISTDIGNDYIMLNRYIEFLPYVECNRFDDVKAILDKYEIVANMNNVQSEEIILKLLINSIVKVESIENSDDIINVIIRNLNTIIQNDYTFHFKNIYGYGELLNILGKKSTLKKISIESFKEKILVINNEDTKRILHYSHVISALYKYFDSKDKSIIDNILEKYSLLMLSEKKLNIPFVVELIENDVNDFKELKNRIFNELITGVNNKTGKSEMSLGMKESVAFLFRLYQKKYFDINDINEAHLNEEIEGEFPEIDWVWFNKHDDNTIKGLVNNRSFSNAKKIFCSNDEEVILFNEWGIKQLDANKYKI